MSRGDPRWRRALARLRPAGGRRPRARAHAVPGAVRHLPRPRRGRHRRRRSGPTSTPSFAAARETGMDQDTIEGVVQSQIENPRTIREDNPYYDKIFMPANLVTGATPRPSPRTSRASPAIPGIEPPPLGDAPGGLLGALRELPHARGGRQRRQHRPRPRRGAPRPGRRAGRESIRDPEAEIAPGFPAGVMPAFDENRIPDPNLERAGRVPARLRRRPGRRACAAAEQTESDAPRSGARPFRRLRLEVHDDVRDGLRQLAARLLHHAGLEPARALRRVGGDDHLVGREVAQRVLDGLVRVVVIAELAADVQARLAHRRHRGLQPLLRVGDPLVDVGGPVLGRRARERRGDDQDLAAARPRPALRSRRAAPCRRPSGSRPRARGALSSSELATSAVRGSRPARAAHQHRRSRPRSRPRTGSPPPADRPAAPAGSPAPSRSRRSRRPGTSRPRTSAGCAQANPTP